MSQVPVKTSVTQIALGAAVAPNIANAPHNDLELGIDNISSYLREAATGHFEEDVSTTTGVTYGYRAGTVRAGSTITIVAASTIGLTVSTINYLEVASDGTITVNTTGFTLGRIPLWKLTTDGAGIIGRDDMRSMLTTDNASEVEFTPTTEINENNVQDAIVTAYADAKGTAVAMSVVFGS